MTQTVDARGLPCPQPVIQTRKAMEEGGEVLSIVDSETSQRNVTRMAEKSGATVEAEQLEDGIYLRITLGERPEAQAVPTVGAAPEDEPLVLVVPSEMMGRGEHDELGRVLIRAFFHTLREVEPLPDVVVFLNSGVKWVVEGSPAVEDLRALIEEGVEILTCGTCLGYYDLKENVAVGTVSNMYTIAETMLGAGRVVHL